MNEGQVKGLLIDGNGDGDQGFGEYQTKMGKKRDPQPPPGFKRPGVAWKAGDMQGLYLCFSV